MDAAQLLLVLFFLKISLITSYGILWLWTKRSRTKNAWKAVKEKDDEYSRAKVT